MELLTLDQISSESEKGDMLPTRAADLLVILAAKYSRAVDNYIVAKAEYAKAFTLLRPDYKSDTACERALDYTETGLLVAHWKYQTRKAKVLIEALNGFIYQKGRESKNEQ